MAKKEKDEIIAQLTALGVTELNPQLSEAKLKVMLEEKKKGSGTQQSAPAITSADPKELAKLMDMLGGVLRNLEGVDKRLTRIEGGNTSEFKNDVQGLDVEKASMNKAHLDQKLVKIVEESLGIDFGIELTAFDDKPGFLFTVVVPPRLSDLPKATRPIVDTDTGLYKVRPGGGEFDYVMEEYQPEDRRSKVVGSGQSYDMIRDHCNRVRSYIVSYYQKLKKPLPEFKIK